jgi:hypothetical protein
VTSAVSFRLPLEAGTPDHASIWHCGRTIDKLGLWAALFAETDRRLEALGLIFKCGTLVDATLIVASVKKPLYEGGGMNPRDPDARVLIPEEAAPQFLDDAAPRNGMMPPPDSEMIAPPITE